MKDHATREAEFRADLAELLAKHNATLDITDDDKPYGQQSGIVMVESTGYFDKEGAYRRDYLSFKL